MKIKLITVIIFFLVIAIVFVIIRPQISSYSDDNPMLDKVRVAFSQINPKYADIPLREGSSAYTENKRVITLCLKNPDTGQYYDFNTIMYVALHELGHVVSKTHGHNEEFKLNFSTLLRKAAELKIYNPRKEIPQTYCGVGPND